MLPARAEQEESGETRSELLRDFKRQIAVCEGMAQQNAESDELQQTFTSVEPVLEVYSWKGILYYSIQSIGWQQ